MKIMTVNSANVSLYSLKSGRAAAPGLQTGFRGN